MVFLSLILTADVHFVLQGVIWLVLGTAAELTPVVSLACFFPTCLWRAHEPLLCCSYSFVYI